LLHLSYPIIGVLHADEDVYYDFAKKYSDRVQVLICVSQRVRKNAILKVPEIDQAHLFTIPCGINLPDINHTTQAGNILRLVYVGRVLHYQKRAGDLVRICELLDNQKVPFHLNIIGHGDALPAIKEGLKKTGLDKHVTFPGWLTQKEVAKYLSESDVLVLTSDFEGTPIAMMEALASGCGFTGTRVSGIEDYEHNPLAADCYSVFTVGDIEDAVNKIRKVAAIPPNTRSMAARALAETEFSMAVCLERYQAAIATLKPAEAQAPKISLSLSQLLYSRAIAVARYLKMSIRS